MNQKNKIQRWARSRKMKDTKSFTLMIQLKVLQNIYDKLTCSPIKQALFNCQKTSRESSKNDQETPRLKLLMKLHSRSRQVFFPRSMCVSSIYTYIYSFIKSMYAFLFSSHKTIPEKTIMMNKRNACPAFEKREGKTSKQRRV